MNIYDLLGLKRDASKKEVYEAYDIYINQNLRKENFSLITKEIEKYMNLGKEAYDLQLQEYEKDINQVIRIVESKKKYSSNKEFGLTKEDTYNGKRTKDLKKVLKKLARKLIPLGIAAIVVVGVGSVVVMLDDSNEKTTDLQTTSQTSFADEYQQEFDEEEYDYENKVKNHFICYYETGEFNSLIEVAQDIIEEYPGFLEGEEYIKNGRTPANYLASCLMNDNPNLASDWRYAQSGTYKLYFSGTDKEYEELVAEGKLPNNNVKSMG